jgi:hypothetical protein
LPGHAELLREYFLCSWLPRLFSTHSGRAGFTKPGRVCRPAGVPPWAGTKSPLLVWIGHGPAARVRADHSIGIPGNG